MKIQTINQISFGRELKKRELKEYQKVLQESKTLIGASGKSILIMPSVSLPAISNNNTGAGNLLDSSSEDFFKFSKEYWGINTVQLLPEGDYYRKKNKYVKPYSGSSFSLGTQLINLEYLTTDAGGNLLSLDDVKKVVKSNNLSDDFVNFQNVIAKNFATDNVLKKAYENFKKNSKLQDEFKIFKSENLDWLEKNSIYSVLSNLYNTDSFDDWSSIDSHLYDESIIPLETRQKRLEEIKQVYSNDIEFWEFKQYLAQKHLEISKNKLNSMGLKLSGDMPIGFSQGEKWANPKAFYKDFSVGWGLPCLNLETNDGIEFLKSKAKLFAKRYDTFRVDTAWAYVMQPLRMNHSGTVFKRINHSDNILKIIENAVQEVKGKDYDLKNIMYEFIANSNDYSIYSSSGLKDEVRNRTKIETSEYMSEYWGSNEAFKNRGWLGENFVIGVSSHDSKPMEIIYKNEESKNTQIEALAKILKIDKNKINSFSEFQKAKFAEIAGAFNNMLFFKDALALKGRYKDNTDEMLDYTMRIPSDFKNKYFKSLESNEGYNPMDSIEKLFVANGFDKSNKKLYKKILKFRDILYSPTEPPVAKTMYWVLGVTFSFLICFSHFFVRKYPYQVNKENDFNVGIK